MKIQTTTEKDFILGTVEKSEAKAAHLLLSCRTQSANTAKSDAVTIIYSELLTSGANNNSRDEFLEKLHKIGAHLVVGADGCDITLSLSVPNSGLKAALKLLVEVLTKPNFSPKEQKRIVTTSQNLLTLEKENARAIAQTGLANTLSKKGSLLYQQKPSEIAKELPLVTKKDITSLHSTLLSAPWRITIGGTSESILLSRKTLAALKAAQKTQLESKGLASAIIEPKSRVVLATEVKSKQNIEATLGGPLPINQMASDYPAFLFGLSVLGKWGGFAGRLMSTVREKEGLTYMIYARTVGLTMTEVGYWHIATYFAPKDLKQGITSTLREVSNIVKNGITDSELKRFATIMDTSETLLFDSLKGTMSVVHSNLRLDRSWPEYLEFRSKLKKLTKAEVNQSLRKYIDVDKLIISLAGPIQSVKKEIASFK
jgi:zinc protease